VAKLALLRNVALPKIVYGGEVFGMQITHIKPLESAFGKCLGNVCLPWGRPAAVTLRRELGLASIHATTSCLRARASIKYPTLLTHVAPLTRLHAEDGEELKTTSTHWTKATRNWIKKRLDIHAATAAQLEAAATARDSSLYARIVRDRIDEAEWDTLINDQSDNNRGAKWYNAHSFLTSRSFIKTYISMNKFDADLDRGVAGLIACRTYGVWTGDRAARRGMIDACYKTRCPCCDCDDFPEPETFDHLLLRCPAWTAQRNMYLRNLLGFIAIRAPGLSAIDTVAVLLGGVASTGFTLGVCWYTKASRSASAPPLFIRVARFLSSILSPRLSLLWRSSTSRGPAEDMAALGGTEA
jgi:hypothetical protein